VTLRRLTGGEVLAGIGGAGLLVAMFLPWYEFATPLSTGRNGFTAYAPLPAQSAWSSFSVLLAFLLLTALLGTVLFVTTANERTPALPVVTEVWALAVATITTILVAIRLLSPPGEHLSLRYGAWLGLACTLAVAVGAWWSLKRDVRP
jgi:hypothetical protein